MEYSKELRDMLLRNEVGIGNFSIDNEIINLKDATHILIAEIDRLQKLHEWIPVNSETMPEIDVDVLILTKAGNITIGWVCSVNGDWTDSSDDVTVTHWQPLPLPPQEQP